MKYEFKKNTIDDYTLIYTNKDGKEVKKDFKRTVEMAENLQGINARAKIKVPKPKKKTYKTLLKKKGIGSRVKVC